MTITAREALQRAIAAAEEAQHYQREYERTPHQTISAYAQLAQAWAAIADQLQYLEDVRTNAHYTGEGGDGGGHDSSHDCPDCFDQRIRDGGDGEHVREPTHQEHRWEDRR